MNQIHKLVLSEDHAELSLDLLESNSFFSNLLNRGRDRNVAGIYPSSFSFS